MKSLVHLKPAKKVGLGVEVADRLRDAILQGDFAPGERLREPEIAKSLEVSRAPIREAFSILEREGLILIRPHRGAHVARLSQRDVIEVYSIRLALERLAVEFAVCMATEQDFETMAAIVEQMERGLANGVSIRDATNLDIQFHDALYRASGNHRLAEMWDNIKSLVYIFLFSANLANRDLRGTVETHRSVLDALRTRDPQVAIRAMEQQFRKSYIHITGQYSKNEQAEETNFTLPQGNVTIELIGELTSSAPANN